LLADADDNSFAQHNGQVAASRPWKAPIALTGIKRIRIDARVGFDDLPVGQTDFPTDPDQGITRLNEYKRSG
jgi:hypothetical protein